jgi:tetratricopeptide (TPR) repeat protein
MAVGGATMEGRLAEAEQLSLERATEEAAAGIADPPILDSVSRANVDAWLRGRPAEGVARIDGGMTATAWEELTDVERPYAEVAIGYAMNGRPDKARAIVARYRAEVTDTALLRQDAPTMHTVLGEIALAEGNTAEAIREFRLGDIAPDGPATGCTSCLPLALARAFDAAGQADSAIAQYERHLATPNPPAVNYSWMGVRVTLPYTHRRLGELYEARGDRERALDHYQTFVDLWRDADPELQPIVAEVRRRMAALGAR